MRVGQAAPGVENVCSSSTDGASSVAARSLSARHPRSISEDALAVREAPPQSALDSKVVPDHNVSSPTYAKIDRRLSSRCRGASESSRFTAVVVSSDCRDSATN